MKLLKLSLASAGAAFVLYGCAGIAAPFIHNPYAGTYVGTFSTSDAKAGPASVSLTNIGNVFGDLTDSNTHVVGKLTGSVDTHLVFNGNVAFSNVNHSIAGKFTKSGGKITGTLNGQNGYSLTLNIDAQ